MERLDFAQRGELKVDFLKYYRLVSRWATKTNKLNVADLELLFYLKVREFLSHLNYLGLFPWVGHLCLVSFCPNLLRCLVLRPETLERHNLKLLFLSSFLMILITSDSETPN